MGGIIFPELLKKRETSFPRSAPLLLLIDHAFRLRQEARKAIETGDVRRAQELAEEAETVCSTEKGRELRLLSSWLLSSSGRN
jgi:hypothetical protein